MLRNKNLRPGELDVRLVVQQKSTSINNVVDRVESWSDLTTIRAKRMLKGGREGFEADQQVATNVETFLVRYSSVTSGIKANGFRVYEAGTTDYYYVTLVEKQRRERWVIIQAELKDG